jgi:hypothetical protein
MHVGDPEWGGLTFGAGDRIGKSSAGGRLAGGRLRRTPPSGRSVQTRGDMAGSFRSTLIRVMAIQVVTLLLLWALQTTYNW